MSQKHIILSIIIPVYRVEKYIGVCLDSLYNQDLDEKDYEIICVNDCSPDQSRNIVLEFQKLHQNLHLIDHETNKMQGAARNSALKVANGDFIWFVDADDYVQPNILKKLLTLAISNQLDILHFNSQKVDNAGNISNHHTALPLNSEVISGFKYYENEFPIWKKGTEPWCRIYKRTFLITNNLFFPEGVYVEDAVHTVKSIFEAHRFQYIDEIVYNYRINPVSIMNENFFGNGRKLADLVKCYFGIIDEFNKHELNKSFKNEIFGYYLTLLNKIRKNVFFLSKNQREFFYKYLGNIDFKNIKSIAPNNNFEIFRKNSFISILSNLVSPPLRFLRVQKRKLFNE